MSGRRVQMHFLETVYPPFTNSSEVFFEDKANQHIVESLRQSKLYMMAGRARATFVNAKFDEGKPILYLEVQVGEEIVDSGYIDVSEFDGLPNSKAYSITVREDKVLAISREEKQVRVWLTPDSLYWYAARGESFITGFSNYKEVCNYDLLYVGISKKRDSFVRLIEEAHEKRVKILSREPQRKAGANVSDEIVLFFYDIEPVRISAGVELAERFGNYNSDDHEKAIADAEKAFVSLMEPIYNDEKFRSYPKGQDGLYNSELDAYSYEINENFVFNTAVAEFNGVRAQSILFDNRRDSIVVQGRRVELYFGSETSEGLDPQEMRILRAG